MDPLDALALVNAVKDKDLPDEQRDKGLAIAACMAEEAIRDAAGGD